MNQPPQTVYGGYAPPAQAPYPNYALPQPMPYGGMQPQVRGGGKSKTAAVILSFFFGPVAWLYTLKKDWRKLLLIIPAAILVTVIEVMTAMIVLEYLVSIGLWLWAFVGAVMRSSEWYAQY